MVPSAPRDTQKGFIVTGFTFSKLHMTIDVQRIITANVFGLAAQHSGRALRLIDYLKGRRIYTFPWRHRDQLRQDLEELVKSGYPVQETKETS
jgi:hypothetical protein